MSADDVDEQLTQALLDANDRLLGLYEILRQPTEAASHAELLARLPPIIRQVSGARGFALVLPGGQRRLETTGSDADVLHAAAGGQFGDGIIAAADSGVGFDLLVRRGDDLEGGYVFAAEVISAPFVRFAEAIIATIEGFLGMARLHQHELELALVERDARQAAAISAGPRPGATKCCGLEVAARCDPARIGGGDLYVWVERENSVLFGVGDVAGKGLPAAMVMTVMTEAISDLARSGEASPAAVVETLARQRYWHLTRTGLFVTLTLGVWTADRDELVLANAGHSPVIARHGSTLRSIPPSCPPIGVLADVNAIDEVVPFGPGDLLVIGSDGLVEQENDEGTPIGWERFSDAIAAAPDTEPTALIGQLFDLVADHNRDRQDDDRTALVLRRTPVDTFITSPMITLPADLLELRRIGEWLRDGVAGCEAGLSEDDLMAIVAPMELAVHELTVNIVEHGYRGRPGEIELRLTRGPRSWLIDIIDAAPEFDPRQVPAPVGVQEHGFGVMIATSIAESLTYHYRNGRNHVGLTIAAPSGVGKGTP